MATLNSKLNETLINLKFSQLATLIAQLVLLVTFICIFVPFSPVMPAAGIDASWSFAMNQVVVQGLSFGKDIIFTFGPYSSIYTHIYHPTTDFMMLIGSGYLAISYWMATVLLLKDAKWQLVMAVALFLAFAIYSQDALLFVYPLIAALASFSLVDAHNRATTYKPQLLIVTLLFAPLGLLLLIKGSVMILGGITAMICASYFIYARKFGAAIMSILAPLIATIILWVLSGQPITGLQSYFASMMPIISGYTEGMAADGFIHEPILYGLISLLLLLSILREKGIMAKYFVLLVMAVYLFVTFKEGFVRQDRHVIFAANGLLLGCFFVALYVNSQRLPAKTQWILTIGSVGFLLLTLITYGNIINIKAMLIDRGVDVASLRHEGRYAQALKIYDVIGPEALFHLTFGAINIQLPYANAWDGIKFRLRVKNGLEHKLDVDMQSLRRQAGFPKLPGTTDIYSYDQAYLFASGNTWNPRPVPQSYSVYTPSLVEINRQHLLGQDAPDNIIFKVQPIDNRIPSLEDGASWPVLLAKYQPTTMVNNYLFLKKRTDFKISPDMPVISQSVHQFGDRVDVPQLNKPIFMAIDIEPTLIGRLIEMLYKLPILQISLQLENGQTREYRIISGMTKSGFLISPLVENTAEFGMLYGKHELLDEKLVKSITIVPSHGKTNLWNDKYIVTFRRIRTTSPVGDGK